MAKPGIISRRVLVVDDEPVVCDALRMMLLFDGHKVETATNAKDALEKFDKGKFDIVMTDFSMPGIKGDELASAIKARAPNQPIIMITAYAEMLELSGGQLKSVDELISKPFLLDNLREAITKVTAGSVDAPSEDVKRPG